MPIKKSELYSRLWQSCDELRGGMDASEYKNYILVLLFIKYVSDKFAGQPYAEIKVPRGASFKDMVALKGNKDIGDLRLGLAAAEGGLRGDHQGHPLRAGRGIDHRGPGPHRGLVQRGQTALVYGRCDLDPRRPHTRGES